MTILEAIAAVDAVKPNINDFATKRKWLSQLDGIIKKEIIDCYEGAEKISFDEYSSDTKDDTMLLVSEPYNEIYIHWLSAQIDYFNGEYDRYANSMQMYNAAYSAYSRHYHRTHKPKSRNFKFF